MLLPPPGWLSISDGTVIAVEHRRLASCLRTSRPSHTGLGQREGRSDPAEPGRPC
jgi:hypothetical protein